MEVYFCNSDMEDIFLLDSFKSLIWTERYWKAGDVDISCDPSPEILAVLPNTAYFRMNGTARRMVLETTNIKSDIEDGDLLIMQGRSLESMLDRRIVWEPTVLSGNLQTEVLALMQDNCINPADSNRAMPKWYNQTNTDTTLSAMTINSQFDGKYTVYKAMCEICEANGIGFRLFYNSDTDRYNFKLIIGSDLSYDQTTNPTVAFTSALNNLINADYVESSAREKNVCLVGGEEGIGNVRTYVTVGSGSGLARREMYVEPSINRNVPGGEMSDAEYLLALAGKGDEELAKFKFLTAFDGEVDSTMYNYGDEFGMGDILQIADNYGHSTKSRVIEIVRSQNESGSKIYPTFETVE